MSNSSFSNLTRGIIRENPVFVMMLGMCPTLGVTTSLENALGMGTATAFTLVLSNSVISLVKNFIPSMVRIPCYIVLITTIVSIIDMLMAARLPALHETLGIYIPLIGVNCIILGRAEAFASQNNLFQSVLDALGMGIGFTLALALLGSVREIIGAGSLLGYNFISEQGTPVLLFVMPPGAFLALAGLIMLFNRLRGANK